MCCCDVTRSGAWCGMSCDEQHVVFYVFVIWNGACGVMWNVLQCYCTMLSHITPPHGFVIWNGAWCGVEWDMGHVTMLLHHALPHRNSIIQHLTAQHSTLHHFPCKTVHTMLCHSAPPHTAHHVRCGVLHHVFCDGEWAYGMWCGVMWNVLQCYQTMLWHITPPHIAHHSRTFQHCTTQQQHISSTFHISSCYTVQTTLCHIAPPCIAHHVM